MIILLLFIYRYGFVHFENESEKEVFFNYVKDHPLRGPRGKILNFNRARTKAVHNRDEDVNRGTAIIAGGPVATPNPNATQATPNSNAVATAATPNPNATPATPNPNSNAVTAAATPNANPNAVTDSQPQQHQTQTQTQSQPQQYQTQTQTQAQTQSQSQSQQLQAQAQTQSQPLPYPQYNIFESSDQFIIYVEACGVARNTIEIEVNKFDAQRIYIKFNYDQDIEDGLHCLKRSFFVPKDEIKMLIQLPKSFDPDKDAKVELLCGMIKISLGKLEKPITKKFKIY
ncbi:unnamed protein product [Rhizophagus irregularis]|nr:unnamed protein product [Rhizophagus irregularis]